MIDLTTQYLGIRLINPIIVGSCSLTSTLEDIKSLEKSGAGAIVLKSIFEEEILNEANINLKEAQNSKLIYSQLSETLDYIDLHTRQKNLGNYLKLIKDVKKEVLIPVIASINCISDLEWTDFAAKIQEAGADALELNIFLNPTDLQEKDFEATTLKIIDKVLNTVKIPVSVKISNYYTNLGQSIIKLSQTGIAGIVLFNRFYSPDIDLDNLNIVSGKILSNPDDYVIPLRWIALLSNKVKCSLAASTGIHDANAVIKQILAGADAVQIVSSLYLKGKNNINRILSEMEEWMESKGFMSLQQMKGKLSYEKTTNPSAYERIQFMKYYGKIG